MGNRYLLDPLRDPTPLLLDTRLPLPAGLRDKAPVDLVKARILPRLGQGERRVAAVGQLREFGAIIAKQHNGRPCQPPRFSLAICASDDDGQIGVPLELRATAG